MSQKTLVQNIGDLAVAVGNNQRLIAEAAYAANTTAIAAGEAASEALAKAEQAMTAGGGGGEIESIATKSASLYCTASLLIENRQTILENISGDTLALEDGRIVCKRDGHVIVTMHDYYTANSGTTNNYDVTIRGYTTKDGVSTQYRMVMGTGSAGPSPRFFSFTDILPVEAGTTIHGVVSAGLTGNSVLSITVTYLPSSGAGVAGGSASGTDTYSTDETDTGKTWVDGKTIYRRVFITQTKATLNTANTIANLASVEIGDVVRLDALITTNNGTTFLLPYWSNTAGVNVGIYGNGDTLREAHTHDEYSNCPLKIILEYTKV